MIGKKRTRIPEMSSVDTLDERDVAQRVLEILAKECQPVPIASLSTELLRDSAQGGEFRAHISSKYGRGIGAFKSFLQNSPVLRDAVSLLQTEFGIRVQLKASGCQSEPLHAVAERRVGAISVLQGAMRCRIARQRMEEQRDFIAAKQCEEQRQQREEEDRAATKRKEEEALALRKHMSAGDTAAAAVLGRLELGEVEGAQEALTTAVLEWAAAGVGKKKIEKKRTALDSLIETAVVKTKEAEIAHKREEAKAARKLKEELQRKADEEAAKKREDDRAQEQEAEAAVEAEARVAKRKMTEEAVAAARRKQAAEVVAKGAGEEDEETKVRTENGGPAPSPLPPLPTPSPLPPLPPHVLRFRVGDAVQCNFDDTRSKQGSKRKLKEWPRGKVVQLWWRDKYMKEPVPYQVRLDCGEFIAVPHDTNACITPVGLCPRERLLQAIEQHCSTAHLANIARENQMDLKLFGNELLLKAAASCNIEAFLWLVWDCRINVREFRGPRDRTVLHCAITGTLPVGKFGVSYFFRNLFAKMDQDEELSQSETWHSSPHHALEDLLEQRDANGQTILHLAAVIKNDPSLMAVLLDLNSAGGKFFRKAHGKDFVRPCEGKGCLHKILLDIEQDVNTCAVNFVDSKGRTAKNLCVLFKNEEAASILDQFCFYLALEKIRPFDELLGDSDYPSPGEYTAYFTHYGDMATLKDYMRSGYFKNHLGAVWIGTVRLCLTFGFLQPLKFLCDSSLSLTEVLLQPINMYDILLTASDDIRPPPKILPDRIGMGDFAGRMERQIESDVIWMWDGSCRIEEFVKKKIKESAIREGPSGFEYNHEMRTYAWAWKMLQLTDDTESVKEALRDIDWDKSLDGKLDSFIRSFEKSELCRRTFRCKKSVEAKLAVLEWLVDIRGKDTGGLVASPHLFMAHRHPRLLQWMFDNHHFELDARLDDERYMELREHVRSLEWLPKKHKKKQKSKAANRKNMGSAAPDKDGNVLLSSSDAEMNMRECSDVGDILLFLSAGYGDLRTFEYVVAKRSEKLLGSEHFNRPLCAERFLCAITYMGMPLLHVAASRGSSEIVKYLVEVKYSVNLVPVETDFDDMNAAHAAFASGFQHIGQYLLEKGCAPVDLRGRDYLWFCKSSGLQHMLNFAEDVELEAKIPRCEEDIHQLLEMLRNPSNSWESIREFLETSETFTAKDSPLTLFGTWEPHPRLIELLQLVVSHSLDSAVYFHKYLTFESLYRIGEVPAIFRHEGFFYLDILCRGQPETVCEFLSQVPKLDGCGGPRVSGNDIMLHQARRLGKEEILDRFADLDRQKAKEHQFEKVFWALRNLIKNGADLVDIEEHIAELVSLGMPDHRFFTSLELIDSNGKPTKAGVKSIFDHGMSLFQYCCDSGYLHLVAWLLDHDAVSQKDLQEGFGKAVESSKNNMQVLEYLLHRPGVDIELDTAQWALQRAGVSGRLSLVQLFFRLVVDKGGDPNEDAGQAIGSINWGGNVLTAAVIFYVLGCDPANTFSLSDVSAMNSEQKCEHEPYLTREGEMQMLGEDLVGDDHLMILRFLLMQKEIEPSCVFWDKISKIRDITRVTGFQHPELQVRMANACRVLVKAGANARKMFQSVLNLPSESLLYLPVLRFFGEECNLDIQSATQPKIARCLKLKGAWFISNLSPSDAQELECLQSRQQRRWQLIDAIDRNISLDELKKNVQVDDMESQLNVLKNRHGRLAIHMAAVSNRRDVVEWLMYEMGVDPNRLDEDGQSAMHLAKQAGSHDAAHVLELASACDKIARFSQKCFRMRKQHRMFRRAVSAARAIQAKYKSWIVFRTTWTLVDNRLSERQNFLRIWGPVVKALAHQQAQSPLPPPCWVTLKNSLFDFSRAFECEEDETRQALVEATKSAVACPGSVDTGQAEDGRIFDEEIADDVVGDADGSTVRAELETACNAQSLDNVMLTAEALRWYKHADPRLSILFLRRLQQLAAGERSRILNKHLVGSKNFSIFETYLDQGRTALRILWTECRERDGLRGILVWYVSKHKHVSKYMVQIDEAAMRLNRQPRSARSLFEGDEEDVMLLDSDTVLLDPMGSTPLKIHEADIRQLASKECLDSLPLRLTSAEKAIIEKSGSVLVLGRSGTGKTICIANKMIYDHRTSSGTGRQLFVCRSARVCSLVQRLQHYSIGLSCDANAVSAEHQQRHTPVFMQLDQLVHQQLLRVDPGLRGKFAAIRKMTFRRFAGEFFDSKMRRSCSLDKLVVWMQIQSFIKGSIEAIMLKRPLQLDEFLELGKDRVRLNQEQRRVAFSVFVMYTAFCEHNKYWDDADRILELVSRLRNQGTAEAAEGQAGEDGVNHEEENAVGSRVVGEARKVEDSYSKIYVDEVQDLTQAEIALLFMLSDSRSLFLAGDTAQSVVEGVAFRFSEVRSVAFQLGVSVPEKPMVLHLNFRSHTGILNLASAVLGRLFLLFPGAASKLPPDEGLYKGPRPGLMLLESEDRLLSVLTQNDGLMLLTHEHARERLQGLCGSQRAVLSIAEAKGLEFPDVAIVDFFSSLDRCDQLRWKEMLGIDEAAHASGTDVSLRYEYPELETQLKLLYTAITRAERSLYVIETKRSVAGLAFFALAEARGLAQAQEVLSSSECLLTHDEWVSRGLDFASSAKESGEVEEEVTWLRRAVVCFDNAGNADMSRRARAHMHSAALRKRLQERGRIGGGGAEMDVEIEGMRATRACIACNMLVEAAELCQEILPHLTARSQQLLRSELLDVLRARTSSSTES
jgi:ankyrin repeat protein